jgi:hypothetical protein
VKGEIVMNAYRWSTLLVVGIALSPQAAQAQGARGGGGRGPVAAIGTDLQITESAPIEVTPVKGAPFSAQAVTEFTQTLGDGNRIERRYQSSVARDSRGRTRREEEIALIGPLAAAGANAPRLVTIVDPDGEATYTLDEDQRVAYRSFPATAKKAVELVKLLEVLKRDDALSAKGAGGRGTPADVKRAEAALVTAAKAGQPGVQDLGTRIIDGVRAQGARMTTTIAAGEIGNLQPIHIVTERWFSPELQMPVLVTRRDPRNGDTTYRLTNIQRGEQPDALFSVPSWYEMKDGEMKFKLKLIEAQSDKKTWFKN